MKPVFRYAPRVIFLTLLSCLCHYCPANTHKPVPVSGSGRFIHAALINRFYQLSGPRLFWFSGNEMSGRMRCVLKNAIDSAEYAGLDKNRYHYPELEAGTNSTILRVDSLHLKLLDRMFTDAAIAWCKDIYQGAGISRLVSYDGISGKYAESDNQYLLNGLVASKSDTQLVQFLQSLEPGLPEYRAVKAALKLQLEKKKGAVARQLAKALNLFRWMHHFKQDKYIIVNIASATLRYYEYDSLKLNFKVVVRKPSTKTPRFAASCNHVIL